MASPYPTSAQEIYDWLEADSELADLLGRYRFSDGTLLPAMAVLCKGAGHRDMVGWPAAAGDRSAAGRRAGQDGHCANRLESVSRAIPM